MSKKLHLNIKDLDHKHNEFLELLNAMKVANKSQFFILFEAMIAQTKEHFYLEESLMKAHNFDAFEQHREAHQDILKEMLFFYEKGKKLPSFGRSYINEYAFDKFKQHTITVDSQFAHYLKTQDLASA